jgi:flagellar motility protein MotE (MotC chaperone)
MKTMKHQPYATKKQPSEYGAAGQGVAGKPSRLCKFLLALVGFKIGLLGMAMLEPDVKQGFAPSSSQEAAAERQKASDPARETVRIALHEPEPELPANAAENTGTTAARVNAALAGQAAAQENIRAARKAPGIAFASSPANIPQGEGAPASVSLEALTRKQEELARREEDLKSLQTELDARFQQMQDLEQRLKVMLKDADEIKDARYRQLVDVLSNMKARQAAEVLSTLDEKIAVRVLAGMRGRQAGEILSLADPVKAARLAEALSRMQMPLE